MMEWIKATPDALPDDGEHIIFAYKVSEEKFVVRDGLFENGTWKRYDFSWESYIPLDEKKIVTHWTRFPSPPEDKTEEEKRLRGCPFCGDIGKIYPMNKEKWGCGHGFKVFCANCGGGTFFYRHLNDAIDAWNRRKQEET